MVLANHICVLDSAVAIAISREMRRDWRVMASPRITTKYAWLYGESYISVGETPIEVARGVGRAAECLSQSQNTLLWCFPQGDHHLESCALVFQRGVSHVIARCSQVPVVCAGIRYTMYRQDRPMCAVAFETSQDGDRSLMALESTCRIAMERATDVLAVASVSIPKRF
jgi:hypothetical protein